MPGPHISNDPDPTGFLGNTPSDDAAREFMLQMEKKLASQSLQQTGG
jgi:hypothetical protein